jgi:DNA invertase Pin-like site-specific DNA recombinase
VRAVGYFREVPQLSLAQQSQQFLAFCQKNGFDAAATFLDSAGGGSSGFMQLVSFLRQQTDSGFMVVIIPDLNCLGDGMTEAARRYFQLSGLGVPVLTIDGADEVAERLLPVWASARANGSVGDRVKSAMRKMAVKGEALGRPPYGYRVGPRKRLVVVQEEGAVVRYIFRLYLKDGLGIRRLARKLNEEGLRTRKNGLWSMVTVRDILRNRAYVGTYSRFGVRVPASHPPLISKEDFQMVQQRLDQRRPVSDSREVSPFLLSGLVYCSYCGNKMVGVTRKQKWRRKTDGATHNAMYRYYQCGSRTSRSLCDYHTHRAEHLEAQVRAMLADKKTAAHRGRQQNGAAADYEQETRRLRTKAKRLDRRLEQSLDAAAAGGMPREKLHSTGLALAAEQLQVEESLAAVMRLAEQQASESERHLRQESVRARLTQGWDEFPVRERQEMLREILGRIVVSDDMVDVVFRP